MVILTNCTFDGHVYNTKRYMEELLAIKPDLVVWRLHLKADAAMIVCCTAYPRRN